MEEHDLNLDEIIDSALPVEPEEEPTAVEESEDNLVAAEEIEERQSDDSEATSEDPAKVYQEAIDKYDSTRNPHDLPEPLRSRELERQAAFTRDRQELAKSREPEPEVNEAPTVDPNADIETMMKQIEARVDWKVKQETAASRESVTKTDAFLQQQMQQRELQGLEAHVRGLPGHTKEIEAEMTTILEQHKNDPQWQRLMTIPLGLEMLHEKVKVKLGTSQEQDTAAKRVEAKQKSSTPAKSRKGDPLTTKERFDGMSPYDMIDKAVGDALG